MPDGFDEPNRTFVTGSGDAPGPQGLPYLMEITITQEGGSTVIRLVNSGFSEDAAFDDEYGGVVSGWQMALATMKHWLEQYPEGQRTHRIVIRPATYTFDQLRPLFQTADGRRQWLVPLVPEDALMLTDTGREVLLAWNHRQAVLGLKAFAMGPQSVVALDFSTWAPRPDLAELNQQFDSALDRLVHCLRPVAPLDA